MATIYFCSSISCTGLHAVLTNGVIMIFALSDKRCSRFYSPPEDQTQLDQICKDDVCRCSQGQFSADYLCVFSQLLHFNQF